MKSFSSDDLVDLYCYSFQSNSYAKETATCSSATCCLAIECENEFGSCTNLSYQTTFSGVLSDGAVAGIVLGCIAFVIILAIVLRRCGRKSEAAPETATTYVQINPVANQGFSPPPAGPYQQQQPPYQQQQQVYQGTPQSYQQPGYQAGYAAGYAPPPGGGPTFMTVAPPQSAPPRQWS